MRTWSVTARGLASVEVQARNWIVALGRGLDELGRVDALARLACEVLPNGTVIARDIVSGTGYVVQGVEGGPGLTDSAPPAPERATTPAAVAALAPTEDDDAIPLLAEPSTHDGDVLAPAAPPDPEDASGEVIFELPADALTELPADDDPLVAIDAAETPLMACQLALDRARERVPAESGAVILEERGYLRFSAVAGPASRKLVGVRLPMGTGVAGYAMEKRRTVVLGDAHQDPRHCGEVDALTGYTTREIAVVPMISDDRVLGVLELMNLGRRFEERDLDAIQSVADALAQRLGR